MDRFQLTDEEVAKRKFEEEHRRYDVYMEDAVRRGEYQYPVKKKIRILQVRKQRRN